MCICRRPRQDQDCAGKPSRKEISMATNIETESATLSELKPPLIDLNRADDAALASLPGIGPKLAARIIAYRNEHGPFLFEEDITQVSGVSTNLYEELVDRLTITIPTAGELTGEVQPPLAETSGQLSHNVDDDVADVVAATPEEMLVEEPEEHPLAIEPAPPAPNAEEVAADDHIGWGIEAEEEPAAPEAPPAEDGAVPMPSPAAEETVPGPSEPAPRQRSRFTWFWTAILGAVLGGFLGLGLSMLVYAGINGSVDVSRSVAVRQVNGHLNELSVELDAVQGDVGILQGDVTGLRERLKVLSGLTARMEQAEETLATFTKEIQALEDETTALTSSLTDLSHDVDTMGETLEAVEAQTERATIFFERLQQLLQEIFTEQPTEPESAAPQTAAPDLEVNA